MCVFLCTGRTSGGLSVSGTMQWGIWGFSNRYVSSLENLVIGGSFHISHRSMHHESSGIIAPKLPIFEGSVVLISFRGLSWNIVLFCNEIFYRMWENCSTIKTCSPGLEERQNFPSRGQVPSRNCNFVSEYVSECDNASILPKYMHGVLHPVHPVQQGGEQAPTDGPVLNPRLKKTWNPAIWSW